MGKKKDAAKLVAVSGAGGPDLGIPGPQLQAITAGLSRVLDDTYTLYLKTHIATGM